MIIVDIITGEEYEIDKEAIEEMDRSQEEYQRGLDEEHRREKAERFIRNADYLN